MVWFGIQQAVINVATSTNIHQNTLPKLNSNAVRGDYLNGNPWNRNYVSITDNNKKNILNVETMHLKLYMKSKNNKCENKE